MKKLKSSSFLFILFLILGCASNIDEDLRLASIKGDAKTVQELIQKGANVNFKKGGWTVLMFVSREGHTDISKLLLEHGADPNIKSWDGASALTIAEEHGHVESIRSLLISHADLNTKNNHGNTALMFGAENGHIKVVEVLLNSKADFTIKDQDGETALAIAQRKGHAEIINLLKIAGAEK